MLRLGKPLPPAPSPNGQGPYGLRSWQTDHTGPEWRYFRGCAGSPLRCPKPRRAASMPGTPLLKLYTTQEKQTCRK